MSKNNLYISYSSASRFKTCPTKYYFSKKYQSRLIPSALPFGKAVESGVTKLLLGSTLEEAQREFGERWTTEEMKPGEYRAILDNLGVQFYASDFDKNLILDEDAKMIEEWADELLEDDRGWFEIFDEISDKLKSNEMSEAELAFYNRVVWKCCEIRGYIMLQAFAEQILPKVKIYSKDGKPMVQKEVSIQNEEGDKLVGYVDFVITHAEYQDPIIIDLKTAAYPYPEHALKTSEQLRTYVATLGEEVKTKLAGYIVLLKKIKVEKSCDKCGAAREGMAKKCKACGKGEYTVPSFKGDVQFVFQEYKDEELDDVLEDYMNVTVAIKNEVNFKNPSNCMQYGRKCEFYDMCWNGKKASEISEIEEKGSTSSLTSSSDSDTTE